MGRHITCEVCQEEFLSNHRSKFYCSQACKQKSYRDRKLLEGTSLNPKKKKSKDSKRNENAVFQQYALEQSKVWAKRILKVRKDKYFNIDEANQLRRDVRLLRNYTKNHIQNRSLRDLLLRFMKFVLDFTQIVEKQFDSGNEDNGYIFFTLENKKWGSVCEEVLSLS